MIIIRNKEINICLEIGSQTVKYENLKIQKLFNYYYYIFLYGWYLESRIFGGFIVLRKSK